MRKVQVVVLCMVVVLLGGCAHHTKEPEPVAVSLSPTVVPTWQTDPRVPSEIQTVPPVKASVCPDNHTYDWFDFDGDGTPDYFTPDLDGDGCVTEGDLDWGAIDRAAAAAGVRYEPPIGDDPHPASELALPVSWEQAVPVASDYLCQLLSPSPDGPVDLAVADFFAGAADYVEQMECVTTLVPNGDHTDTRSVGLGGTAQVLIHVEPQSGVFVRTLTTLLIPVSVHLEKVGVGGVWQVTDHWAQVAFAWS